VFEGFGEKCRKKDNKEGYVGELESGVGISRPETLLFERPKHCLNTRIPTVPANNTCSVLQIPAPLSSFPA
jgi:hypothetical protein